MAGFQCAPSGRFSAPADSLTVTHVTRWQQHRRQVGYGHVYQGRFKSFPIAADDHYYHVARYVERNARRANLVERAEAWRWSSLWRRESGTAEQRRLLSTWPVPCPRNWRELVNRPQTEAELEAIRRSVNRGQPYGEAAWIERCAEKLSLEFTLRPRGRPRLGE
jgi:putative transposase